MPQIFVVPIMQMCDFFVSVPFDYFFTFYPIVPTFFPFHSLLSFSLKTTVTHILILLHFSFFFHFYIISLIYFFTDTCAVDGKLFAAGFTVISKNALLCGGSNEISFDGAYETTRNGHGTIS